MSRLGTSRPPGERTVAIGANVRAWREKRQKTRASLADELGYASTNAVQRIENGWSNLTVEQLCALAEALDIAPCTLLEGVR